MARDAVLAERQRAGEGPGRLVRTHGWMRPAMTLGRTQPIAAQLPSAARSLSIELVRRPTGGGWLMHLPGDLAVSVAVAGPLPAGGLRRVARQLAQAIALGLSSLGRPAMVFDGGESATRREDVCFQRTDRDEVVVDRTKVAGVALCRAGRGALVQAAIPLVIAPDPIAAFERSWDPRRAEAVEICQGLDRALLSRRVEQAYAAVCGAEDLRPWSWPPDWLRRADRLRAERYPRFDESAARELTDRPEVPQRSGDRNG
jgi:hypothetical protein